MGKSVGTEIDCGKFHSTQIGEYFSKIGKKKFSFVFESEDIEGCTWFNYTPTERENYNKMRIVLKQMTNNNEDYYDNFLKYRD